MCDQDHYEDDLKALKRRMSLTRRELGTLAAGVSLAMLLPRAANAVDVKEQEVSYQDAGRHGRLLLRASRDAAPRRPCWFGRTSSGCGRRSGRWASGSPSRATRCSS